jgi:hypothetical protein
VGKCFQGLLYLVYCWTLIPAVLGLEDVSKCEEEG